MTRKVLISIILALLANITIAQPQNSIAEEIKLSPEDLNVFKNQAIQKIKEFESYVLIISDKKQASDKRASAEQEALKLFYDGAQMESTQKDAEGKTVVKTRLMKEYLYRLKILPYTKVEIKFYDIIYFTEFTRGADSIYRATATIFQDFTGFTSDNMVYTSTIKQEISIIIDLIVDEFYNDKHWKLLLGDIKSEETKTN